MNKTNAIKNVKLSINGVILEEVNYAKYLGILIDNKLKWKEHLNAISLKLSKGIYDLRFASESFSGLSELFLDFTESLFYCTEKPREPSEAL